MPGLRLLSYRHIISRKYHDPFSARNMLIVANATSLALKAKLFRGFSDPSRLAVLEALRGGPLNVSEIVEATGLNQSNASNHLGCLLDCGLVSREQRGRFVFYSLSEERVERLLGLADELLSEVARGVYECTRYGAPTPAERNRDD